MAANIRAASAADVPAMAELIAVKRTFVESLEPVMWRPSEAAAQMTTAFFTHQLGQPNVIARVAESGGRLIGFVVGVLQDAPPVFAPGGKTVLIDDFAIIEGGEADAVASDLLDEPVSPVWSHPEVLPAHAAADSLNAAACCYEKSPTR